MFIQFMILLITSNWIKFVFSGETKFSIPDKSYKLLAGCPYFIDNSFESKDLKCMTTQGIYHAIHSPCTKLLKTEDQVAAELLVIPPINTQITKTSLVTNYLVELQCSVSFFWNVEKSLKIIKEVPTENFIPVMSLHEGWSVVDDNSAKPIEDGYLCKWMETKSILVTVSHLSRINTVWSASGSLIDPQLERTCLSRFSRCGVRKSSYLYPDTNEPKITTGKDDFDQCTDHIIKRSRGILYFNSLNDNSTHANFHSTEEELFISIPHENSTVGYTCVNERALAFIEGTLFYKIRVLGEGNTPITRFSYKGNTGSKDRISTLVTRGKANYLYEALNKLISATDYENCERNKVEQDLAVINYGNTNIIPILYYYTRNPFIKVVNNEGCVFSNYTQSCLQKTGEVIGDCIKSGDLYFHPESLVISKSSGICDTEKTHNFSTIAFGKFHLVLSESELVIESEQKSNNIEEIPLFKYLPINEAKSFFSARTLHGLVPSGHSSSSLNLINSAFDWILSIPKMLKVALIEIIAFVVTFFIVIKLLLYLVKRVCCKPNAAEYKKSTYANEEAERLRMIKGLTGQRNRSHIV